MEKKDLGKTSLGIETNLAGLLSYVAGWVTGLIFFLVEKDNKFVRFHAMQSMIVFGALTVAMIAIGILWSFFAMVRLYFMFPLLTGINSLLSLAGFILWIVLMIKAYQGEEFKLPVVGDIAEKNSGKA
jgi:uncharacterized membrane protein